MCGTRRRGNASQELDTGMLMPSTLQTTVLPSCLSILGEEIPRGIMREPGEPSELAWRASRVLLHHQRLQSALELAVEAVKKTQTADALAQLVRTLGILVRRDSGRVERWKAEFL
jgi:hypothetical protein